MTTRRKQITKLTIGRLQLLQRKKKFIQSEDHTKKEETPTEIKTTLDQYAKLIKAPLSHPYQTPPRATTMTIATTKEG